MIQDDLVALPESAVNTDEGSATAETPRGGKEISEKHEVVWEPTTDGREVCYLPSSIALLDNLSGILNMDTWNKLTGEERDSLTGLLPEGEIQDKEQTLSMLFGGEQFFFENPIQAFHNNLKAGNYHFHIAKYRKKVQRLQQVEHMYDMQIYRDNLFSRILDWKKAAGMIPPGAAEEGLIENPPTGKFSTASDTETSDVEVLMSRKRRSKGLNQKPQKKRKIENRDEESSREKKEKLKEPEKQAAPPRTELKQPERSRKRKGSPSSQKPPIIFVLFAKIRKSMRFFNFVASLDAIIQKLKETENIEQDRLPQYPLKKFVKMALEFLSNPPTLIPAPSTTTSPTGVLPPPPKEPPLVAFDKTKSVWRWLDPQVPKGRLQSLEQLFYFASGRNQLDPETSQLVINLARQQKCATTIEPSSPEAVASHRMQEAERYKYPNRPYTYVTNGMKTVVGPLKRTGAASSANKPREHFLLKPHRPSHINLLCLVRDAAARLPGGVGTRPDVALLLRDSQWVAEDVPISRLNSVVSGALDRLHSQKDPPVRFDADQKLWIYLHRRRKESEFETPSTKSKRSSSKYTAQQNSKETPPQKENQSPNMHSPYQPRNNSPRIVVSTPEPIPQQTPAPSQNTKTPSAQLPLQSPPSPPSPPQPQDLQVEQTHTDPPAPSDSSNDTDPPLVLHPNLQPAQHSLLNMRIDHLLDHDQSSTNQKLHQLGLQLQQQQLQLQQLQSQHSMASPLDNGNHHHHHNDSAASISSGFSQLPFSPFHVSGQFQLPPPTPQAQFQLALPQSSLSWNGF